jgi:hypothetical protein
MKIHAIYCVFAVDYSKKENLIITESKDRILFPIREIENPRHLHNEIHYNLQSFFKKTTYNPEILKNINFSHLDIQNDLVYKYLEDKPSTNIDLEKDILLLCGAILESPYDLESLEWKKFDFVKSFSDMDITNSVIDFVVEKSIL